MRTFPGATSPERWRTWLAFEVDGVPVAEIARQEGAPQATIYNRVRLAREDLAAMLDGNVVLDQEPPATPTPAENSAPVDEAIAPDTEILPAEPVSASDPTPEENLDTESH